MSPRTRFLFVAGVVAPATLFACGFDTAPRALRATPPGTGPAVTFDTEHRPLPAIPIPNDIATFADPTSRTGIRIDASVVAPTNIETAARKAFDEMEGWGTFSPISVQFTRTPAMAPTDSVIDIEDVKTRMQNDDFDLSNDPVYVVNLTTGVPAILDVGNGNFPATLRDLDRFWANDPHIDTQNVFFESHEEGAGLTQADYTPALDLDWDGVLDHPNTLGSPGAHPGVDDMLTWYERETDTLIVRPLLPLEEKTEYAVVLTDRLHGRDGQPVRSPFPQVYHPQQAGSIAKLRDRLSDASRAGYYGDIAGSGLDHVAFAWTFTTQPVHEDMQLLRNGLYGKGPFARFASMFPPKMHIFQAAGQALTADAEPDGWQNDPTCATRAKTPFVVNPTDKDVASAIHQFFTQVVGASEAEATAEDDAISNIDHILIGNFQTPYLQGDPTNTDPEEARFHVNFQTGEGDVNADTVHFWLTVPKAAHGKKAPFDITFWEHGVTGDDSETMIYAGDLARQGIATIGIVMPEHGLSLGQGDLETSEVALRGPCLVEWVSAIDQGRSREYNGDGSKHSGWFWWTSHAFHVRDNVRQGLLDMMNTVRILRSFDGVTKSDQDFNNDGTPDLAGDFDGDGTVDVGGPTAKIFASGESLGGMMTEGIGGIEPYVVATAPMSGGAGMTDIGARSYGVTEAVFEQILGPILATVPAMSVQQDHGPQTNCTGDQRSLRMYLNDGDDDWEIEVACLSAQEIDQNMTVVLTNKTSGEKRCAGTLAGGLFRVPVPATIGDELELDIYDAPNAVDAYIGGPDHQAGVGCNVPAGIPIARSIASWEQPMATYKQLADSSQQCPSAQGCAQFRSHMYPVGSPLVAPNEGYGLQRNTPDMRRLLQLVQSALDPADNANYAPYYMMRPLYDENGVRAAPHGLLAISTTGDGFVDIATGYAFARAAGALPFLPPSAAAKMPDYADYVTPQALYDAYGHKTPNQVLIDNGSIEGIARLARTHAGPMCTTTGANYDATKNPSLCTSKPVADPTACAEALFDADWDSEGGEGYDQPHLAVPLRLARYSGAHVDPANAPSSLASVWAPRLLGAPFSDDGGWTPDVVNGQKIVGTLSHYLEMQGRHTWDVPDLCKRWDFATYGNGIIARFFASAGTDVYYLSHPKTHECLEDKSCDLFK